ncbi:hypothetical protein [Nocardia wallacei]|uniref:hypothetical protein n=1 Tax=Nocardia wallacei TaxID=480035 RepID=UPI00245874CC|nr:hypothetical protein [Nocardia wallacei]
MVRDRIPGIRYIGRMRENAALNAAFEFISNETEYDRAFAVAQQAEQRLHTLEPAPDHEDVIEAIIDRGELPDDFAAAVEHHNAAVARREAERLALENTRTYAAGRCWALFSYHAPRLLEHLHGQLTALIDECRPAAETLADLTDPADVLRAGATAAAAFTELDEAWKRYITIRGGQNRVVRETFDDVLVSNCKSEHCTDPAASDLIARNLDTVFPDWRLRADVAQKVTVGRVGVYAESVAPPWPQNGPLQLSWLLAHDAELWVPTSAQVEQLHAERHRPTPTDAKRPKPGPEQQRRATHQHGVIHA